MKVADKLFCLFLALIFVFGLLLPWNMRQEKRIGELESLVLATDSLFVSHIDSFQHTDSLIIVNVNRIYKLIDVEWEIRLKPRPIEEDTTKKIK